MFSLSWAQNKPRFPECFTTGRGIDWNHESLRLAWKSRLVSSTEMAAKEYQERVPCKRIYCFLLWYNIVDHRSALYEKRFASPCTGNEYR
ncbi:hypothetical protein AVEN_56561-1 [Araneus ventricosus]|uniref:Uncharacterized protein n=1 Tax=Araneus ventricosus TaxID=182803 RepID=A0A4Y2HH41_ARAVE|nr:hypothetical protein AVEN_56561-1 [Araneus ventricosus]